MDDEPTRLNQLVESVFLSARYRSICPDLIRRIGAQELSKRRGLKAAVKATKDRLHQVGGAYLARRVDYAAWLEELRQASRSGDPARLGEVCTAIMGRHSSSRERLPILAEFYAQTLGGLPAIHSALDVGCGLNPLALPWMPLAEGAEYYACDIYQDLVAFVNEFLALVGVPGGAEGCDVVERCPTRRVDVALVLKTIPCLEQLDKSAGRRLLDTLDASHLLVSFPVHSLCGAGKGMAVNYEARFWALIAGRPWSVRRYEFASELAFLVSK